MSDTPQYDPDELQRFEDSVRERLRDAEEGLDQLDLAVPHLTFAADERWFMETDLEEFFGEGAIRQNTELGASLAEEAANVLRHEHAGEGVWWEMYQRRESLHPRVRRALEILFAADIIE